MNTLTPTRLLRSVHHCPRRTAYSLLGSKVKREKFGELSLLVPSEGPVPGLGILSTELLWEATASKN